MSMLIVFLCYAYSFFFFYVDKSRMVSLLNENIFLYTLVAPVKTLFLLTGTDVFLISS